MYIKLFCHLPEYARLSGLSQTTFVSENLIKSYTNPIKPCGEPGFEPGRSRVLLSTTPLRSSNTAIVACVFQFRHFSKCPGKPGRVFILVYPRNKGIHPLYSNHQLARSRTGQRKWITLSVNFPTTCQRRNRQRESTGSISFPCRRYYRNQ